MAMHVARKLRKSLTPWERRLWKILRNRRLENLKFRRQFKVGKYIVDFCCLEAKLIIELDGGQHSERSNRNYDEVRQRFLESLGYKVLRFWNNEVEENLEGVIEQINKHL